MKPQDMICLLLKDKEILPKTNAIVSLDLRIAIPKGFFGKNFFQDLEI